MLGLFLKLIVCPITVIVAWWLFPNVDFAYWYQPIILGVLLAVVGHLMEVAILKENTVGLSTFLDLIASIIIVYFGSMFFEDTFVTFWGAVLTAGLLGITELIQHRWLVRNGRTEKGPTTT